ncbi:MAG: SPOR domain-containing protein [Candidatus Marinimicrobia bacterium]|nr:SPOR domain-containing protein [Candidatus Neomarinimicrobiota bacterium]MCF7830108.1 SPOR domain-containing protein [Candidatus Neomarinimicrobiota bacterium]MCF7882155.1 SPOR domain-containing protein [Candidatus Neomarinimicrobiota bacterium]
MRKRQLILIGLISLLLIGCGADDRTPIEQSGTANQPVNLEIQADDMQADYMVEWSFTETPSTVSLSQYDFQPINTSPQVSFIPPDTGMYRLQYAVTDQSGEEIAVQPFVVNVSGRQQQKMTEEEDTTAMEQPEESTEEMAETAEEPAKPKPSKEKASQPTSTRQKSTDRADLIPRVPGRYTVQVSAWRTFSKAESVANTVKKLGYDAYIQRAKFPDTGQVWYRVRVGSFSSPEAAKSLRRKLVSESELPDESIWVDFQRKDS